MPAILKSNMAAVQNVVCSIAPQRSEQDIYIYIYIYIYLLRLRLHFFGNRQMKVNSGLVGISNNVNATQRFFLATPEMSRMSAEYRRQFRMETVSQLTEHCELSPSEVSREHSAVDKIKTAIIAHDNPFAVEGDRLHSMITHAYVPDKFVEQILNANDTDQKIYEDYVTERINGNICLWAKVTKVCNKMFMSGNKTTTIKLRDKTVYLKVTKDLYGRLMIFAKSTRH